MVFQLLKIVEEYKCKTYSLVFKTVKTKYCNTQIGKVL